MLTPPKLYIAIIIIPEITKNINNPSSNTSRKYTRGNYINGLLLLS
jgi:hypothetical protein